MIYRLYYHIYQFLLIDHAYSLFLLSAKPTDGFNLFPNRLTLTSFSFFTIIFFAVLFYNFIYWIVIFLRTKQFNNNSLIFIKLTFIF